ncbi:hypothetical protein F5Y17DRAFT_450149 [Xylariaceae sp. FL0594]|nr:hypothetical protein F5Y17DRAFT_450149 [Xylariaceae sp. FL0594]
MLKVVAVVVISFLIHSLKDTLSLTLRAYTPCVAQIRARQHHYRVSFLYRKNAFRRSVTCLISSPTSAAPSLFRRLGELVL